MGLGKLMYDCYKGNIPTQYATLGKTEREDAIRKELLDVLGLEKFERKAFRKAFRDNKNKIYAIQEEVLDQVMQNGDYQKNAFFNEFVEVKNRELGDDNKFYIEGENALEFAEFSGSHWDLKRQRVDKGQSFGVEVRDYGIKIYEYFERVASGRADMATLITLIADAAERKLADLAQASFAVALSNLPTEFKVGGSYNEQAILTAAAHVEASTGIKPNFVGTQLAIRKLQGVSDTKVQLSDSMKDDYNNIGFLPVWNTYKCMELKQGHKMGTFEFTMPNNVIYMIAGGEKPVKLFLEGETEVKEISDGTTNADRTMEQTATFKAGCGVIYNKMFAKVDLA